jgi:GDPmannose 4,6-dehydratase
MIKHKTALITGITGQDGSYLTEYLLEQGYSVHGIVRRHTLSGLPLGKFMENNPDADVHLHYGDLQNTEQISALIQGLEDLNEIYHLGAQSHVHVSFETPEHTGNVGALGTTRLLEAIRRGKNHDIRFYNAATSELFGLTPPPQSETTNFAPRSPYACAKLYAYWMTKNYREGYGLFTASGVLFNHETVSSFMPMFCKINREKTFDIKPICEIVPFNEKNHVYQSTPVVGGIQVWGKNGWVDVTYASAYPHNIKKDNKRPKFINARCGAFMESGSEKQVQDIRTGDKVEVIELPLATQTSNNVSEGEAELLGMMVADGSITYAKRGTGIHGKFTKTSQVIKDRFSKLWHKVTNGTTVYCIPHSGFNPEKIVGQLRLNGGNDWLRSIDIYTDDKKKRVPKCVLNAPEDVMLAFLKGYNACDGLKENQCTYEFKNFKTNSATLAMGLWYLIDKTTKQEINLSIETKTDGRLFYSLNLLSLTDSNEKEQKIREQLDSNTLRGISRDTGISRKFVQKIARGGKAGTHWNKKESHEVKKIIDMQDYSGWFYDLETTSGEFHCGIGKTHVHNSPRRGDNFVTRKITKAIAMILANKQKCLELGDLSTKRDWGFAPEYVTAMHKILQLNKPEDFVIGTGETHSVQQFVNEAFKYAGLKVSKYVKINQEFIRPTDVNELRADVTKAYAYFGWRPHIRMKELARIMVDADMRKQGLEVIGEGDKLIKKYFPKRWWQDD